MSKRPMVKVLVGYHAPATLLKSDVFVPIHLGRALCNKEKDTSPLYDWLKSNMIGDDTGENISVQNPFLNEMTGFYWAWKNYEKLGSPDYIGFMHYRRHLCFDQKNAECPDKYGLLYSDKLDEEYLRKYHLKDEVVVKTVENADVVVAEKTDLRKLGTQTPYLHYKNADSKLNIRDLDAVLKILYKKYPAYRQAAENYLQGNFAYFTNIFIAKKELFFQYCEWAFDILQEAQFLIRPEVQNTQEVRVLGYISEWLWGIFLTYQKQQTALKVVELKRTFVRDVSLSVSLRPRTPDEISIVMSCDDKYAPYLGVTLQSLAVHASKQKNYTVYILDEGLQAETKRKLNLLSNTQVCIRYVDVRQYIKHYPADLFYTCNHFSQATWYRIFIPGIFKHFERVVYCDCDAVFLQDPSLLWQIDLKDNLIGAVHDTEVIRAIKSGDTYFADTLALHSPLDYFQCGMLLCNIAQMKKEHFTEKCLAALQQVKTPRYVDQDIMNMVCEGKVYFLEAVWNVENHLYIYHSRASLLQDLPYQYYQTYQNAVYRANYLHFSGECKPWQAPDSFQADVWWHYARQTPFYEEILYKNKSVVRAPLTTAEYWVLYLTYARCRLLSHITWGTRKQHYKQKKNALHTQVRVARAMKKK